MKCVWVCLFVLFGVGQPVSGEVVSDSFAGQTLNTALWAPWFVSSTGGSLAQLNQQLAITGQGNEDFEAGVRLRDTIIGNFDIQISFALGSDIDALPRGNNARVGLGWSIGRIRGTLARGATNGAGVVRYEFAGEKAEMPYVDTSGRLRVTRTGARLLAYYWKDGFWHSAFTSVISVDAPVGVFLCLAMDGSGVISASFDDFYLQADQLNSEVPVTSSIALPHLAVGGPWTTELIVSNVSDQSSNVAISFYGDDGRDLALPISGAGNVSTISTVVPANGTSYYEAADSAGPVQTGWGLVSATAPVSVQAVFRNRASNGLHYEAAVPSNSGGLSFVMPFDATTFTPTSQPLYTGFALANLDSENAATITCIARDASGTTIPNGISIPEIPARGHWADYLFPNLSGQRGTLECTSTTMVTALGLRFVGSDAFSSLSLHWK